MLTRMSRSDKTACTHSTTGSAHGQPAQRRQMDGPIVRGGRVTRGEG